MSPTKPTRSRTAGETKPKSVKPRASKAKTAAGKTAKPRASRATKPRAPEAAERQLDLIAPTGQEAQSRPAPARSQATVMPRAALPAAPAPVAADREGARRGLWLFILIPLLMLGSFWIGRISNRAASQEMITIAAPTPAASTTAPGSSQTAPSQAQAAATAASTKKPGLIARLIARHRANETSLVEVSVGTTSRGGLTLRFDHPVAWQVTSAQGGAEADLDVRGVRALGTFPRNLPLPPGVTAIRAGITAPDTLNLRFNLQPGIRAFTVPGIGPAGSLDIYFRTPAEEAADAAEPATGACGSSASPQTTKALTLLQASLDKNPGYEPVRQALALLATCAGDGAKAERLLAAGSKDGGGVKLTVTDVALRYARGDMDGALKELKGSMPAGDAAYQELLADLETARQP